MDTSLYDTLISKYEKRTSKHQKNIKLGEKLENIKNGKYKVIIEQCRLTLKESGKIGYDALKSELPAVTFCGVFNEMRKSEKISFYNKLIIIDIDDLESDNIDIFRKKIKNDEHTYSMFLSPSGNGLKILIKVESDVEHHKLAFKAIDKYYREKHGIEIDLSGSDCSRLCYVSWDPELYINEKSSVFKFNIDEFSDKINIPKKTSPNQKQLAKSNKINSTFGLNKTNDREMMKKIIQYLKKNNKSITSTHDRWYKCAYAIANTFSYDLGLAYFLKLSELDGERYDEYKSRERLEYCYITKRDEGGIHFASIISFAKEEGFLTKVA